MPRRGHLLALACAQQFCCSGVLFGWPALQRSLNEMPGLDPAFCQSVFVAASTINMFAPMICGPLMDRWGPRVCSSASLTLVFAGFLTFGLDQSRSALAVSLALIAAGGPGSQASLFHISNLFPERRNTTITIIASFFSLSFTVFLVIVKLAQALGLTLGNLFLGWSFIVAIVFVFSCAWYPDAPFAPVRVVETPEKQALELLDQPAQSPPIGRCGPAKNDGLLGLPSSLKRPLLPTQTDDYGSTGIGDSKQDGPELEDDAELLLDSDEFAGEFLEPLTLCEQISAQRKQFVQILLFFLVGSFWFNFTIGSFHREVDEACHVGGGAGADAPAWQQKEGWRKADAIVEAFVLMSPLGAVVNPIVGWLLDSFGFSAVAILTILTGATFCALMLFAHFVAAAAMFVAYQVLVFTFMYSFVAAVFGFRYYGALVGIITTVAAVANGLLQPVVMRYSPRTAHEVQLATLGGLLLLIPLANMLRCCLLRVVDSRSREDEDEDEDDERARRGRSEDDGGGDRDHQARQDASASAKKEGKGAGAGTGDDGWQPRQLELGTGVATIDPALRLTRLPSLFNTYNAYRLSPRKRGANAPRRHFAPFGSAPSSGFAPGFAAAPGSGRGYGGGARSPRGLRKLKRTHSADGLNQLTKQQWLGEGQCRRRRDLFPWADDITARPAVGQFAGWGAPKPKQPKHAGHAAAPQE